MRKFFKHLIKSAFGIDARGISVAQPVKTQIWSIGIFAGKSPLEMGPARPFSNPVLTRDSVSDVHATFVADPFMLQAQGTWHMFFEVMNG